MKPLTKKISNTIQSFMLMKPSVLYECVKAIFIIIRICLL